MTNLSIQLALSQAPVSKKSSDFDSQVRGSANLLGRARDSKYTPQILSRTLDFSSRILHSSTSVVQWA